MIKKAIIPVAGMGTRFLPATKAQPKEMLPIVDKPVIQYIVEEAVDSGIEEIIFVTGSAKRAIEDHFDSNFELNSSLEQKGKIELLKQIKNLESIAKISYVRQPHPLGDGHAILCAKHCVSTGEDFAVLFGDDITYNPSSPALSQLCKLFSEKKSPIIGVKEIEGEEIEKYGVVATKSPVVNGFCQVSGLIEKPSKEIAPSNLGVIGKYICTYEVFDSIEKGSKGSDGELRLIDGLIYLLKSKEIFAKVIEGERFDTGSKIGWLTANISYALRRGDLLSKELKTFLRNLDLK